MTLIEIIKKERMGFINSLDEADAVAEINRFQNCLVRCGNGRFVTSAQNVRHFCEIISNSNEDYVRDISLC